MGLLYWNEPFLSSLWFYKPCSFCLSFGVKTLFRLHRFIKRSPFYMIDFFAAGRNIPFYNAAAGRTGWSTINGRHNWCRRSHSPIFGRRIRLFFCGIYGIITLGRFCGFRLNKTPTTKACQKNQHKTEPGEYFGLVIKTYFFESFIQHSSSITDGS